MPVWGTVSKSFGSLPSVENWGGSLPRRLLSIESRKSVSELFLLTFSYSLLSALESSFGHDLLLERMIYGKERYNSLILNTKYKNNTSLSYNEVVNKIMLP